MKMLKKIKINKTPGEDRILYEVYKNAHIEMLNSLALCHTTLYSNTTAEKTFEFVIIYQKFKEENLDLRHNCSDISFMNCVAKIMIRF